MRVREEKLTFVRFKESESLGGFFVMLAGERQHLRASFPSSFLSSTDCSCYTLPVSNHSREEVLATAPSPSNSSRPDPNNHIDRISLRGLRSPPFSLATPSKGANMDTNEAKGNSDPESLFSALAAARRLEAKC